MMKSFAFLLAGAALALSGCASSPQHAGPAATQSTEICIPTSEREIAALFERWNGSLQTGDAHKVVANYAMNSILLPTLSNTPRVTPAAQEEYFHHFLENQPSGHIDWRQIKIDCTTAVDIGLYTFTFRKTGGELKARYTFTYKWDGRQWLITTHHSSAMPEKQ